jgi:two-component system, LuxR family, response regulator FixJ
MIESLRNVYIVDDDDNARQSLAFFLKSMGYYVKEFSSGPEILSVIDIIDPGCILIDLSLPIISGLHVLRLVIQSNRCFKPIIITGNGAVDSAVESLKIGAFDFIEKPFKENRVIESINTALDEIDKFLILNHAVYDAHFRLRQLSVVEKLILDRLIGGFDKFHIAFIIGCSELEIITKINDLLKKLMVNEIPDASRIVYLGSLNYNESEMFIA